MTGLGKAMDGSSTARPRSATSRRRHFRSAFTIALALSLGTALLARSQPIDGPDPDFVAALWVAQPDRLVKLGSPDGSFLSNVPTPEFRTLSIDSERAVVWALGDGRLWAFGFDGQLQRSVLIPDLWDQTETDGERGSDSSGAEHHQDSERSGNGSNKHKAGAKADEPDGATGGEKHEDDRSGDEDDNGTPANVELALDSASGGGWFAVNKDLYRFDAAGAIEPVRRLPAKVQGLAFDGDAGRLWVATDDDVTACTPQGAPVQSLALPQPAHVDAIALDRIAGHVWVATKDRLLRYARTGGSQISLALKKLELLQAGGDGGLWAADKKTLYRVDRSGAVLFALPPFDGHGAVSAMAIDPGSGAAWLARDKMLRRVETDSVTGPAIEVGGKVRALAGYADLAPPSIAFTRPEPDSYVADSRPPLEMTLADSGTGVDRTTLTLTVDNEPLDVACERTESGARCIPHDALSEGRNEVAASVADFAGNESEPDQVAFTVDTVAPEIALHSPLDGAVSNRSQQYFVGELSEAAILTLNEQRVDVGLQHEFEHGPVGLDEGLNAFSLVATDYAGNVGRIDISQVLDTVPPLVTAPPDRVAEASSELTTVDLGTAQAVDAQAGELTAAPDQNGPFPLGETTVVWQAVDFAGNVATANQTITVQDTTAPMLQAPPAIAITAVPPVTVDLGEPTTSDLFEPVVVVNDAPEAFPAGVTTVTWTATDANSNIASAAQTITVTPPPTVADWGRAQRIEEEQGPVVNPAVVYDSEGNATVTWAQRVGTTWRVLMRRFEVGVGWTGLRVFDASDAYDAFSPQLIVEDGTVVTALWVRSDSAGSRLWASRRDSAGSWSIPSPVSGVAQYTSRPECAELETGETLCVWAAYDGIARRVWAARGSPMAGWGSAQPISHGDFDVYGLGVVPTQGGNAVATWTQNDDETTTVWTNRYDSGANWATPERLAVSASAASDVAAQQTPNGGVVFAWAEPDAEGYWGMRLQWRDLDGVQTTTQYLPSDNGFAFSPTLLRSGANTVLVWYEWGDGPTMLRSALVGPAISAPVIDRISANGDVRSARFAAEPAGGILGIWTERSGGRYDLRSISRAPDTAWVGLNGPANTSDYLAAPALAWGPAGKAIAVWIQRNAADGNTNDVWSNRYPREADSIAPLVTPPPDVTVEATGQLTPVELGSATAVDDEDGPIAAVADQTGPFALGTHSVTWSAADSAGNVGSAVQTVVVQDTTPPVVIPPPTRWVTDAAPAAVDLGTAAGLDLFEPVTVTNDAPAHFGAGNNTVTWTATDPSGNQSSAVQLVVVGVSLAVSVSQPATGATINGDSVVVLGAVSGPPNVGVTVNGIPAAVSSDWREFSAVVPLAAGTNTLTVVATAPDGQTASAELIVESAGSTPFSLVAVPGSGPAPLAVEFSIEGATNAPLERIDADFDGDGEVDSTSYDLAQPFAHTYVAPGNNVASFHVVLTDGSEYSLAAPILVQDAESMDRLFEGLWAQMNNALVAGDLDIALTPLNASARRNYGPVFDALLPQMPEIVRSYSDLRRASLSASIGEYAVNRTIGGRNKLFLIYFLKGADGVWRIDAM